MHPFNESLFNKTCYDVIIIGTGIAGLLTALNMNSDYSTAVITKSTMEKSNSNLAQGGIAASIYPENHYNDTLRAGAFYNRRDAAKILIEDSQQNINKLIKFGVNFDRDETGRLQFTREGGHSNNNVLHFKDATGKEIIRALREEVRTRKNIEVMENVFVIDLIVCEEKAQGVMIFNKNGEKKVLQSKVVVIATGGIGQVYGNTTNEETATGDGIAIAYRAGAQIEDIEFIQFHPTALYKNKKGQRFLISEALRGEGAVLKNIYGEAFMSKYHIMKELAPRDIVSRSIFKEMEKTNMPYVYLDITHKDSSFIKSRFPMIYEKCLQEGIDMTKDWIPVAPAEHYVMGGIRTDLDGKTNIQGLYACGECACTGVHGANRLASNSLLEGAVFGNRTAQSINREIDRTAEILNENQIKENFQPHIERELKNSVKYEKIREIIKDTMDKYVSIIRSEAGLNKALHTIENIKNLLISNNEDHQEYYEVLNMVTAAWLVAKAALERKVSLGAHYRAESMEG